MVAACKQLEILEPLVEVRVKDEDFLKVVETLNRIGVASTFEKKLYPSVHILHKGGRYWLLHFKHLFLLDGLSTNITEEDLARYFTICSLLDEWGLVSILDKSKVKSKPNLKLVKIVPFRDKKLWVVCPKFTVGK